MLLSEIIFNIKNLKAGGIQSDDDNLSDEQLIFIFDYYRAKFYKQTYDKFGMLPSGMEQTLFKVMLQDLDETTVLGVGKAIEDVYSTEALPKVVRTNSGHAFKYVGTIDGSQPYNLIPMHRMPLITNARYSHREGYYYPIEDRLIVKTYDGDTMDYIGVIGVFERPREAMQFILDKQNAATSPVGTAILDVDYNYEYPVSADAIDTILKMMYDTELKVPSILPTDTINDTTDNTQVNAQG